MNPFANDIVLNDLIERIVHFSQPQRVIVFGSYALGTPTAKSDIDILVIKDHLYAGGHRERELLAQLVDFPFPLDITCLTPAEVERELKNENSFLSCNMKVGVEVYNADKS